MSQAIPDIFLRNCMLIHLKLPLLIERIQDICLESKKISLYFPKTARSMEIEIFILLVEGNRNLHPFGRGTQKSSFLSYGFPLWNEKKKSRQLMQGCKDEPEKDQWRFSRTYNILQDISLEKKKSSIYFFFRRKYPLYFLVKAYCEV